MSRSPCSYYNKDAALALLADGLSRKSPNANLRSRLIAVLQKNQQLGDIPGDALQELRDTIRELVSEGTPQPTSQPRVPEMPSVPTEEPVEGIAAIAPELVRRLTAIKAKIKSNCTAENASNVEAELGLDGVRRKFVSVIRVCNSSSAERCEQAKQSAIAAIRLIEMRLDRAIEMYCGGGEEVDDGELSGQDDFDALQNFQPPEPPAVQRMSRSLGQMANDALESAVDAMSIFPTFYMLTVITALALLVMQMMPDPDGGVAYVTAKIPETVSSALELFVDAGASFKGAAAMLLATKMSGRSTKPIMTAIFAGLLMGLATDFVDPGTEMGQNSPAGRAMREIVIEPANARSMYINNEFGPVGRSLAWRELIGRSDVTPRDATILNMMAEDRELGILDNGPNSSALVPSSGGQVALSQNIPAFVLETSRRLESVPDEILKDAAIAAIDGFCNFEGGRVCRRPPRQLPYLMRGVVAVAKKDGILQALRDAVVYSPAMRTVGRFVGEALASGAYSPNPSSNFRRRDRVLANREFRESVDTAVATINEAREDAMEAMVEAVEYYSENPPPEERRQRLQTFKERMLNLFVNSDYQQIFNW